MSGTCLDSSTDISDTIVNVNVYSPLLVDHPSKTERGSVCMYYNDYSLYRYKRRHVQINLPVISRIDLSKGSPVNRFWNGKRHCKVLGLVGLACDVLKFVFFPRFFHK